MKKYYILITMAVLILSGSNSYANCAWVLWVEENSVWEPKEKEGSWGKFNSEWKILGAYTNESACKQHLNTKIKKKTSPQNNTKYKVMYKTEGNDVSLLYFHKNLKPTDKIQIRKTYRFSCLPDTIDPRRNEGK